MSIGRRQTVRDAMERVTGRVEYVSNEQWPGMVYGRVLRSTVAHGRIRAVDPSPALDVPGVVAAIAGSDVPGAPDDPRLFGIVTRDTPVLAGNRVRYIGEPIAAVAAVSIDAADEAVARIRIEIEPLPPILSIADALADGSADEGGERLIAEESLRLGDVDAQLGRAAITVSETFDVPSAQGVPLEPHVAIASWGPDEIVVHTATQTPFQVRAELAHVFGLPLERVRVVTSTLGGGFGSKSYTRIEPVAVLLAKHARRPVCLLLSRSEEFHTVHRQAATIRLTTAVDADGRLRALRGDCTFAAGPYVDNLPRILKHGLYGLVGPYRIPNVDVTVRGVHTNTQPCGPLRAPGSLQVQWAREAHLDTVAAAVGLSGLEIRGLNLIDETDRFPLGGPVGPVHLRELLDGLRPGDPRRASPARRRGTGFAVSWKTTSTPSTSNARVSIDQSGRVRVLTSTVEMGQGARTALAQIAASALAVPFESVDVTTPDTTVTPPDWGTVSSRSTFSMGGAIDKAAHAVRSELLDLASRALEIAPQDLRLEEGRVQPVDGSSSGMSFGELVRASGGESVSGSGSFTNEPIVDAATGEKGISTHYHQAAAAAVVEADVETGAVEVLEVLVATHAGVVVNPTLAELQSEGNVAFGVGQALMEEIVFDEGQIQNASLADYLTPSLRDMPARVGVALHEDPSGEVHGIGETALPAVIPAITNAIANATGARIRRLPATPERILQSIADARRDGSSPPATPRDER